MDSDLVAGLVREMKPDCYCIGGDEPHYTKRQLDTAVAAACEQLRADLMEQCRLLGMSGEREAKHLAQIARLELDNAKLRSVGIKMLDWLVGDIESGDHSGSDDPDDYDIIVLAKETLTERGDQSSSTR